MIGNKQVVCNKQAILRYTWPGNEEKFTCLEHAQQLKGVSEAMGFSLQLIPLSGEEQEGKLCTQNIKEE